MNKLDILIIRPYVTLKNESSAVDRYVHLNDAFKKKGISSKLFVSSFRHNQKLHRSSNLIDNENLVIHNSGGYSKNISLKRLLYELSFSWASLTFAIKNNPRVVVVGEPLFFCGFLFLIYKLVKKTILVGDFIDLLPEAYKIKFKNLSLYYLVTFPFYIARWFRIRYIYDSIFSVTKAYFNNFYIYKKKINIIYWGYSGSHLGNLVKKKNKVVYAGSLGEGYDIETLIELGKTAKEFDVFIAGSGPKSIMCIEADKFGYIKFLGQLKGDELNLLYFDAAFGVLPYKKNSAVSMPIKFFDYVKYDMKILNSTSMECSEMIKCHDIGIDYTPEDVNSLYSSLIEISSSKSEFIDRSFANKLSAEFQYDSYASYISDKFLKKL